MTITAAEVSDEATSNDGSLSLTFTSSEATSTFASGDISVTNGTLSNFATSSTTVYTATFTPTDNGACTIDVAAGAFTDAVGNGNSAATQFNWTYDDANLIVVINALTMTITAAEVDDGDTSNDGTLTLTFTSSKATSTFASEDISVTNGTLSNFATSSTTVYTATFTPTDNGACSISVEAGKFSDALGINNIASNTFIWTYNSIRPTMTITAAEVIHGVSSIHPTLSLIFTSSDATTNFTVDDITVDGGLLSNFTSVSSTIYTATFTPSKNRAWSIFVADNAYTDEYGNDNSATTPFNWIKVIITKTLNTQSGFISKSSVSLNGILYSKNASPFKTNTVPQGSDFSLNRFQFRKNVSAASKGIDASTRTQMLRIKAQKPSSIATNVAQSYKNVKTTYKDVRFALSRVRR